MIALALLRLRYALRGERDIQRTIIRLERDRAQLRALRRHYRNR